MTKRFRVFPALTRIGAALPFILGALTMTHAPSVAEETRPDLRVPAFTAYSEPESGRPEISEETISGWSGPEDRIVWYGELKSAGILNLGLLIRLPEGGSSRLRLQVSPVSGKSRGAVFTGEARATGGESRLTFGTARIASSGYYRFDLRGMSKSGETFGAPVALLLDGPAAKGAHFNPKPRRNAASVHLFYPLPTGLDVAAFYNEVTVKTDPVWSYYMACGFHRGYFGIQVNSPTERRIIFSVWDSGEEPTDRGKVRPEDRVQLLDKGRDVVAEGFGNEGTGGHSHLVYPWKTGKTYRFLVTARPEGSATEYAGYFYFPEKKSWGLIARFRAPKDGEYLHGLYSFNENFVGDNGQKKRLAEFGSGWVKTPGGKWHELLTARFYHDDTGKTDRLDYDGGTTGTRFYLSNGGFLGGRVKYGDEFHRPPSKEIPSDIRVNP